MIQTIRELEDQIEEENRRRKKETEAKEISERRNEVSNGLLIQIFFITFAS